MFQVLAIGRNATALMRLVSLDPARVVPVMLTSQEAPHAALKNALGQQEVDLRFQTLCRLHIRCQPCSCLINV